MLKSGCVGRASLLANLTPVFSWSPSGWAIGDNFTAEAGFSLRDIWISWALCLAKNCQKQNDEGVWNSTVPSNTVKHLYPNPALPQHGVGVGVEGSFPSSFSISVDASGVSFPTAVPPLTSLFWMQYVLQFSYEIQTLLFPTTSLPPVSFLLFLFRFNAAIGLYLLLLPEMSP